jgi:hypothetical protein
MTSPAVSGNINLLQASVLSMVEFDDDIFAGGHCFDWNQHPTMKGLFCPFAHRLPAPEVASLAKDLATEYNYLGNTSEFFFLARKNAEKVIAKNEQYIKGNFCYSVFHYFMYLAKEILLKKKKNFYESRALISEKNLFVHFDL